MHSAHNKSNIKTNTNDDEDDDDDTTQRTKNKDDIYGCVAIESEMRASKM